MPGKFKVDIGEAQELPPPKVKIGEAQIREPEYRVEHGPNGEIYLVQAQESRGGPPEPWGMGENDLISNYDTDRNGAGYGDNAVPSFMKSADGKIMPGDTGDDLDYELLPDGSVAFHPRNQRRAKVKTEAEEPMRAKYQGTMPPAKSAPKKTPAKKPKKAK